MLLAVFRRTNYLIGLILAVVLMSTIACGLERTEPFAGDPEFRMSQPAQLFFANIRSSQYYHERPAGTELDMYRSKAFSQKTERPMLIPIIVQAYLKDEAYLFVKPNSYSGLVEPLHVSYRSARASGTFDKGVGTRLDHRTLADSLAASLSRGDSLFVRLADGQMRSILEDAWERKHFLTVMADYARLME